MRGTLTAVAATAAALALVATGAAHADSQSILTSGSEDATSAAAPASAARLADGAVTLGQTVTPASCAQAFTIAQYAEGAAPSFVVPSNGVLTSFSHLANPTAGSVRLVVLGPSATPGHRTVVGKSALQPVTVSSLNTFPTRVPVAAGTQLALQTSVTGMGCVGSTIPGDVVGATANFDPDTTTDFPGATSGSSLRINISAVLEPDVDGDQFGDVSQDACPQSALTQGACPAPETTLKRRPFFDASGKVVFKFKSSIPGSTFLCKVDRRAYRPCSSPLRKRFGLGTHKVRFQAISPFGIPDPTPLKVRVHLVP